MYELEPDAKHLDIHNIHGIHASSTTLPSTSSSTFSPTSSHSTVESWLEGLEGGEEASLKRKHFHENLGVERLPFATNKRARQDCEASTDLRPPDMGGPKQPQHNGQIPSPSPSDSRSILSGTSNPSHLQPSPSNQRAPSQQTFSPAPRKDAKWVAARLKAHGMFQDHQAWDQYPEFQKMVKDITNGKRGSHMKEAAVKAFLSEHQKYARINEDSLLNELLPIILKRKRTVRKVPEKQQDEPVESFDTEMSTPDAQPLILDPQDNEPYYQRYWSEDGITTVSNGDFQRNMLPHNGNSDNEMTSAMKKEDGMTTPRPDRCWGLDPDLFPAPDGITIEAYIEFLLRVSPAIYHAFMFLEGKSNKGDKDVAENQARRGGASLVFAARNLNERLGLHMNQAGPDASTFVFSHTWSPGLWATWVHWAEVTSQSYVRYHMNLIDSFSLMKYDDIPPLRRLLCNIMDWGCDRKLRGLDQFHNLLHTWQLQKTRRQIEEAHKEEMAKLDEQQKAKDAKKQGKKRAWGDRSLSPSSGG